MKEFNHRLLIISIAILAGVFACSEEQINAIPPLTDTIPALATKEEPPVAVATIKDSAYYHHEQFQRMPYRILLPRNYDPSKEYPLLIFLHGISERGSDNEKQLKWGASLFLSDSIRSEFEAFIVFPQCPLSNYWFDSRTVETVRGMIGAIQHTYSIDPRRISMGGLSMGAYGTYAMVAKYPSLFNAAVAISGDGDVNHAKAMSNTRWRIFAGKRDDVVPSDRSEKMAAALRRSGASVDFTLYADADHTASWVNAFLEPDFCSWIFGDLHRASIQ